MALENKLGITESTELAKAEERISKTKALEMFQQGLLDTFEVGTFRGLSQIHKYRRCGTGSHSEHRQGRFPFCPCPLSYLGPGKHQQDAAIHV